MMTKNTFNAKRFKEYFLFWERGGGNKDYKIDLEEGDLKLSSSSFTEDKGRLDCANMFSQMNPNKFRSQTNS